MKKYTTKIIEVPEEYQELVSSFSNYHLAQSALWFKTLKQNDPSTSAYVLFRQKEPLFLARVASQAVLRYFRAIVAPFGPLVNLEAEPTADELSEFIERIKFELSLPRVALIHLDPFSFDAKEGPWLSGFDIEVPCVAVGMMH